jgi:hypothetical protein
MKTILVNPLDETPRATGIPAPRPDSLSGKTIGLLDISKWGGNFFLDQLERLIRERCGVKQIVRVMKPTFTKPAPQEVIDQFLKAECAAVIEALAD